jgi:hypothetical protein
VLLLACLLLPSRVRRTTDGRIAILEGRGWFLLEGARRPMLDVLLGPNRLHLVKSPREEEKKTHQRLSLRTHTRPM